MVNPPLVRPLRRSRARVSSAPLMATIVLALGLGLAQPALASDLTDVIDAADGEKVLDFTLMPMFKSTLKRAKITREAPCNPNVTEDPDTATEPNNRLRYPRLVEAGRCTEPETTFNKELRGWRQIYQIDLTGKIGIFRDLELHATFPFILSDVRGLHFAGNGGDTTEEIVDSSNSSVDPSDQRIIEDIRRNGDGFTTYRFFNAQQGNEGPERAGFGDMNLGIAWNPFNQERDDTKATLKLGFDYLIPTGDVAKPGNTGVGRGVHELQFSIASSKRFRYLEPYTGVRYILPIASDISLFQDRAPGQTLTQPGQRAEVVFGNEFIPYEDKDLGNKFVIDLGLHFAFTAEGRDYNLMFDGLAQSYCNGLTPGQILDSIESVVDGATDAATVRNAACRWILEQPANAQQGNPRYAPLEEANRDTPFGHDGITDYESFATFGAHLGLYLQIRKYVQLRTRFQLQHEQEHFITTARTGVDSGDDDDTVRFDDPNERNPYYNPVLDAVGNRFRVEETTIFTWSAGLAIQL